MSPVVFAEIALARRISPHRGRQILSPWRGIDEKLAGCVAAGVVRWECERV